MPSIAELYVVFITRYPGATHLCFDLERAFAVQHHDLSVFRIFVAETKTEHARI